jgi:hypothetical protein
MSRGVVLWPDGQTGTVIRELWDGLSDRGLPSLASHTHRLHQPHCSLSVAEELSADEALAAVGVVPSQPIPLLIGSVGVFPPNGALFLARNSISPTTRGINRLLIGESSGCGTTASERGQHNQPPSPSAES